MDKQTNDSDARTHHLTGVRLKKSALVAGLVTLGEDHYTGTPNSSRSLLDRQAEKGGRIPQEVPMSQKEAHDRAREWLYIVAERAVIALAHHVADDDAGSDGAALRDLRQALTACESTHPMALPSDRDAAATGPAMALALTLDGIKYAMPLEAVGEHIRDAAGQRFMTTDGPQQAKLVARTVNMAAGYVPFAPVTEVAR